MSEDRDSQFINLKQRLDALRQTRAHSEGALAQHMERLKSEFGCATIDAARKKYAALDAQVKTLGAQLDTDLATLKTEVSKMEEAINGNG